MFLVSYLLHQLYSSLYHSEDLPKAAARDLDLALEVLEAFLLGRLSERQPPLDSTGSLLVQQRFDGSGSSSSAGGAQQSSEDAESSPQHPVLHPGDVNLGAVEQHPKDSSGLGVVIAVFDIDSTPQLVSPLEDKAGGVFEQQPDGSVEVDVEPHFSTIGCAVFEQHPDRVGGAVSFSVVV